MATSILSNDITYNRGTFYQTIVQSNGWLQAFLKSKHLLPQYLQPYSSFKDIFYQTKLCFENLQRLIFSFSAKVFGLAINLLQCIGTLSLMLSLLMMPAILGYYMCHFLLIKIGFILTNIVLASVDVIFSCYNANKYEGPFVSLFLYSLLFESTLYCYMMSYILSAVFLVGLSVLIFSENKVEDCLDALKNACALSIKH